MKVLIAPDSFKGSLTAKEVSESVALAVKKIFPNSDLEKIPFSDGGEGAIDLFKDTIQGKVIQCNAVDPYGKTINKPYFIFEKGKSAWIELSQASGLMQIKENEKNPLLTSTYGTGLQIKHALKSNCENIFLGLGGSATHDLGAGIFVALGGKLLSKSKLSIPLGGGSLNQCNEIDDTNLIQELKNTKIIMACDVTNPLFGDIGAANTYAAQKGAKPKDIKILEKNGLVFAELIKNKYDISIHNVPGGGAAGGCAAGIFGLLGGVIKNGFDLISKHVALEEKIKKSDLVITGEGSFDKQSLFGKVPYKIASIASNHRVPTIIIAGKINLDKKDVNLDGPFEVYSINPDNISLSEAMRKTNEHIIEKLEAVLSNLKNSKKLI
ncbi:MAG: glycerate kinase [Flavobacteriaceae bacterium]|jgi:glycerate 2-kinase|nr:glycerate kinase [Flavobacteriaceae bacterium]